jgi:hypothetical protein
MKPWKTRTALAAGLVLLAIQLIPVDRSNPPAKLEIPAPAEVKTLLERSCYDCHSNRTRWPWYSYVAPASWFVADHVHDGREDLNLTEWPLLDNEAQQFYLGEMKKMIEGGEMPLRSYLLLHRGARLSDDERRTLLTWIDEEVLLLAAPSWP